MADWLKVLAAVPLFSFLRPNELAAVHALMVETTHQKGDVICRAGDEGDKFYIVVSGQLEVWAVGEERRETALPHPIERRSSESPGRQRLTGTLKRGDCFGEMALLEGGKRSATVIVKRQADLISLDKASFDSLFVKDPRTLQYFARVLSKRLASASKGEAVLGGTMTISISGPHGLKGKSLVASGVAAVLHDLTGSEVLLIRAVPGHIAPEGAVAQLLSDEFEPAGESVRAACKSDRSGLSVLDVPVRMDRDAAFYVERSSNLIAKVSERFRFVVFDLGSEPRALVESASGFSDALIDIVEQRQETPVRQTGDHTPRFQVINLFNPHSYPIPINHCQPFVIPKDPALSKGDALGYLRSNRHGPAALPIRRLARKLIGATVGVALGGGAAFGIAHLGVLAVLEQNDIPIDILAGCSQGSIIGAGYAAGIGIDEMIDIAHRLGKKRNFLLALDPTLSQPGILAGNRFTDIFTPLLRGNGRFENALIPYRIVATDIENGERVELGEGQLTDAFRASSSVPMVFAPYKIGERVLVDGGISDPVPAEVVRNMGADICIAVNVVPPLKKGLENEVSRTFRLCNRFNPLSYLGDSRTLPNLFDIIMNSMQTLQYELGNFTAISANVLINPDLADFTWIEYYRSDELIQRGREAAEHALAAIRHTYDEKLAPFQKQTDH
jgi:NTE family protein